MGYMQKEINMGMKFTYTKGKLEKLNLNLELTRYIPKPMLCERLYLRLLKFIALCIRGRLYR